jgi:hypothetical protein
VEDHTQGGSRRALLKRGASEQARRDALADPDRRRAAKSEEHQRVQQVGGADDQAAKDNRLGRLQRHRVLIVLLVRRGGYLKLAS